MFFRLKAGKTGVGQAAGLDWIGRVGWGGLVALAEKKSPSYSIGGRRQAVLDNQEHRNLTRAQRARLERFGAAACVDIHCHCLPALDDGPKDADKAIALCRALADDGTTVAVATPHQLGRYEGKNQADEIRTAVSDLNALIADASIPLTVVPGGDVRVDERLAALIAADRVLTLADGGRYILLELPHEVFVDIRLLVSDAGVVMDGEITFAALILFGTRRALGRYLSQAEVILEYRSSDASGPARQREEYRQGFFGFYDDLWNTINLRNDTQHYQAGLFILDIPTFDEGPVREVMLNAVSHRDYQLGGSIFLRQYPRRLRVESPGGFPVGVNLDNILDRQSPRNRRIADILAKCGLVERSGQGMNLMFEQSIRQSKSVPDFTGTDQYQVVLTLPGEVQDPRFVRFLEKIGREQLQYFSTADFLALDLVHREQPIPERLKPNTRHLVSLRILETVGRGRGARAILSRNLYSFLGKAGAYTRTRGLDRETNMQLLLKHIRDSGQDGTPLGELAQVLPALTGAQVKYRLRLLQEEGRIFLRGKGRGARWFPKQDALPKRAKP